MTVNDAEELVRASRVLRRANASFLVNLARIVEVTWLSEGDAEDDYFVEIPSHQLHVVGLRVADAKFAVCDRFDVGISAFPIPVKAPASIKRVAGTVGDLRTAI
jgi:hypothetical protein